MNIAETISEVQSEEQEVKQEFERQRQKHARNEAIDDAVGFFANRLQYDRRYPGGLWGLWSNELHKDVAFGSRGAMQRLERDLNAHLPGKE